MLDELLLGDLPVAVSVDGGGHLPAAGRQRVLRHGDARQAEQPLYHLPQLVRVDAAAPVLVEHVEYPGQLCLQTLQLLI